MRLPIFFLFVFLGAVAGAPSAVADPAADRHVLQAELARLTVNPKAGPYFLVPDGRSLHPGDQSTQLPVIRDALAYFGFVDADLDPAADKTFYDDPLAWQVRRFQLEVGLVPDGVIGGETRRALRFMDADRVQMLQQSLSQLDLPTKGRYITVNVAAAMLRTVEDGQTMLSSRVVIGRKDDQTPTFSARINAVLINPAWIVPDSIVQKEFGGNPHTEQPGPANPLGQLLLELPNRYEIFLHSTNEPALFNYDERAYSHGCVRVQEVEAVARWLLGEDRWASEGVDAALGKLSSHRVSLDPSVAVYLEYRTATVAPSGVVIYHPDPYGLAVPPPDATVVQDPNALQPVVQSAAFKPASVAN